MSNVQELVMDLINDGRFGGDIPDEFIGLDDVCWWQTAPGPTPKLEKLFVRMPTSWFSNIAVNWTSLLTCKPKEPMFFRASRHAISFDETTACKSIRYLATDCEPFCEDVNMLASRMPQLEGLYIMSKSSSQGRIVFYDDLGGDVVDIQREKQEWKEIARSLANIIGGLKYVGINSVIWLIDRTSGIALYELDRMENDHEAPNLFKIEIPYEFDVAHAAKFWVANRVRDDDELM
ncbi:uncharacterized protein GGS22DRAFT_193842 [Annulohypoxylon maeteangense]|uniref:uncharacterized protein n=1 Tax=Annulohypoxylon maeteangense TaxID=1927788 RepID=UPI002008BD22|nr:uncharacterized protein GGS22DRAFT_193842 [Annulohypoxylon maeteangense]KAI0879861.1 hypothetical protein GGS22DRAFT_193842 [Annulohypoxylon maeteangense]